MTSRIPQESRILSISPVYHTHIARPLTMEVQFHFWYGCSFSSLVCFSFPSLCNCLYAWSSRLSAGKRQIYQNTSLPDDIGNGHGCACLLLWLLLWLPSQILQVNMFAGLVASYMTLSRMGSLYSLIFNHVEKPRFENILSFSLQMLTRQDRCSA